MKGLLKVGSEGIDTNIYQSDIRFYNNIYLMISEDIFPSGNFPKVFSHVITSQMCNFSSGHFSSLPQNLWEVATWEVALGKIPLG